MLDAVAEPRSAQPTLPWISTMAAVLRNPIPSPITSEPTPATAGAVPGFRTRKASAPAGSSAAPNRRVARRPKRPKLRAATVAPIGQPSTMTVSVNPATSAERPITPWTNMGRKVVRPMIAMPLSRVVMLVAAIRGRAHSEKASMGSRARRSCQTNDAAPSTNTTPARTAVRPPPTVPASVMASIRAAIVSANNAAPATSRLRTPCATSSRRKAAKPAAAARPIGRLIQKIQPQLRCWMISPPASGPRTDEMPHTLASQPWIRPRSSTE